VPDVEARTPRGWDRSGLRYPSDLTDTEWAMVAPMILPARHGGRERSVNVREVLNGIFYILSTGCQWKALSAKPHDRVAVNAGQALNAADAHALG
jgi:transposase